jgi:hypothetical protein
MRKILCFGAALALPLVITTAGPAAADTSACTHHFSGPQICIRLEGRNHINSTTGVWTNPPKDVRTRPVTLFLNGKPSATATAKRVGETLSYTWPATDTGTGTKICVRFKGSARTACDTTKYIGDRANL